MSKKFICKWCEDYGCVICGQRKASAPERAAASASPDVIFPADFADHFDVNAVFMLLGFDAVKKAFSPGGGGVAEIQWNLGIAAAISRARKNQHFGKGGR